MPDVHRQASCRGVAIAPSQHFPDLLGPARWVAPDAVNGRYMVAIVVSRAATVRAAVTATTPPMTSDAARREIGIAGEDYAGGSMCRAGRACEPVRAAPPKRLVDGPIGRSGRKALRERTAISHIDARRARAGDALRADARTFRGP
jgi:hypothetical protein